MTLSRFSRFAIGVALLAASPAVAQYQELPADADVVAAEDVYSWSIRVTGEDVVLAGDVPYLSVKELLSGRAGDEAIDRMGTAEGAPRGFMLDAITALEVSALLSEGSVTYAEGAWTVTGALSADTDRAALDAVLGERTAAGDPWVVDLNEEIEPEEDAEQSAEASDAEAGRDTDISKPTEETSVEPIDDSAPKSVVSADATEEQAAEPEEPAASSDKTEIVPATTAAEIDADQADESAAALDPDYAFTAEITEGGLVFSGQVPDAATRFMAGNMASGLDGVSDLIIAEGAPQDFIRIAFAGIAALEYLETGRVSLADGQWRIEGEAAADTESQGAVETLDRLSDADIWEVTIAAPDSIDICREQAESYMADRAILFGSGSARLTEDSEADLIGLAEIFAICPSAPVYVEGHTDADGGAEDNLILSLSRAEAVVDGLVDLGIDPGRLYAVGYGASLPIASNETAAGKAQNRRIVFSFEDVAGPGEGAEL